MSYTPRYVPSWCPNTATVTRGYNRWLRSPEAGGCCRMLGLTPDNPACWRPWLSKDQVRMCRQAYREGAWTFAAMREFVAARFGRNGQWADVAARIAMAYCRQMVGESILPKRNVAVRYSSSQSFDEPHGCFVLHIPSRVNSDTKKEL